MIATRARDFLAISSVQNWNGATVEPSRFLTGISLRPSAALPAPVGFEEEDEPLLGGLFL